MSKPWVLTEEGNPYIKYDNQKKRYAAAVWPIPEFRKTPDEKEHIDTLGIGVGQAFAELAFIIHKAQEEARSCRAELRKDRNEVRAEFEAEIEALEEKLDRSLAIFSDLEWERYRAFTRKHYQLHNNGKYRKDDGITIHMAGTGIGTCYELECPVCHEKEDITDVASW